MAKQLTITSQQIPNYVTDTYIVWTIEQGNDTINVYYNRSTKQFKAKLIIWDDGKQDWVSEPLVWDEIKHTIPTLVS